MTLLADHDALLLDLDGVLYTDDEPVVDAADAVARAREAGRGIRFITNNASKTPDEVARRLRRVGIPAEPQEVLTSAQAAAQLLVRLDGIDAGATVAVVGGAGLLEAVGEQGLRPVPVRDVSELPAAVVQGFSPDLGWRDLAAAVRWVRAGAPYVASNLDLTIPTATGIAPGNGLLVRTVATAAGIEPVAVAGKPEPFMFTSAASSCAADAPLVIGDRLDTDIAGGRAAGQRTALVLTGVHGLSDLLAAPAAHRPDLLLRTMSDLFADAPDGELADAHRYVRDGWVRLDALDDGADRDGLLAELRLGLPELG